MNMVKLIDIVANLSTYDAELTIYAAEPWACDTEAVVTQEPDTGELPPEAAALGASYFVEVFVANEFLEGWRRNERPDATVKEQCERLIHYAVHDA
jgi:hypothetical protein